MAILDFANPKTLKDKKILHHIQKVRGIAFSEIWLTMLHHPSLTQTVSDLGQKLRFEGVLSGAIREAIILYVASHCHVPYEWAVHIAAAKRERLATKVLALLKKRQSFSAFPAPYRDALEAAQAALDKRSLPSALQKRLVDRYKAKGLVEIVLLAGYYQMLASFLNAFEVAHI